MDSRTSTCLSTILKANMKEVTLGEALDMSGINYDSLQYIVLALDPLTGYTHFLAGGAIPALLAGTDAIRDAVLKKQNEGLN
jgi:hypothetical protein